MTDHLHPKFEGYKIIGRLFLGSLEKNNLLPDSGKTKMSELEIDNLVDGSIGQSKLDSVLAKYRILILKNDWPFSETRSVKYMLNLFNAIDFVDSTALKIIDNKLSWEQGHRGVATYYLDKKEYNKFISEMNTLITQYPFIKEYYSYAAEQLLNVKLYDEAFPFLIKGFNTYPDAFFAKWIGIISLSQYKTEEAIHYLNKSLDYSGFDPQVLYNLAGAYSIKKKYEEALQAINKCLQINPAYPLAENLKMQIEQVVKQIN
jgi:tetratricopeptide (TPR) repeat protein